MNFLICLKSFFFSLGLLFFFSLEFEWFSSVIKEFSSSSLLKLFILNFGFEIFSLGSLLIPRLSFINLLHFSIIISSLSGVILKKYFICFSFSKITFLLAIYKKEILDNIKTEIISKKIINFNFILL